jgi:hypothetical protein
MLGKFALNDTKHTERQDLMKMQRYRVCGLSLLIVVSAVCLYNCGAQDYSFLKSASGSVTCYTCKIEDVECGQYFTGQSTCGPLVGTTCSPTACPLYCNGGGPSWYCKDTSPEGGNCAEVGAVCAFFLEFDCLPDTQLKYCWCQFPGDSGYRCTKQICVFP